MSIQSINLSVLQMNPASEIIVATDHYQEDLDREMKEACKSFNVDEIARLVTRGANLDQVVLVNYFDSFKIFHHIQDPDYVSQQIKELCDPVWEEIKKVSDTSGPAKVYVDRLIESVNNGWALSTESVVKIADVVVELLPVVLSEEELKILSDPEELTLYDFAFLTRSLDLIKALMERGAKPSSRELADSDLVDEDCFTKKSEQIIEYLIEKGVRLDEFLEEDNSLAELMERALCFENTPLVQFLERHEVSESLN